ncbi:MAG: chemotaxis protein methyltransferase CheR, partial [Candidatus Paceibacteria bacterium]
MRVTEAEMVQVAELVEELCGIVLDSTKGYLIENRFGAMLSELECSNYAELVRRVRCGDEEWIRTKVISAITTNETLFFRDHSPFEALRHKVLPELFGAKEKTAFPKRIRIWSAACSTGQEPYSIAMLLDELLEGGCAAWDIQILATDISEQALSQAREGVYGDLEIRRGLSDGELDKHFTPEGDAWRIKPHLQRMVRFERRNLLESFAALGEFDVIFCRNV